MRLLGKRLAPGRGRGRGHGRGHIAKMAQSDLTTLGVDFVPGSVFPGSGA